MKVQSTRRGLITGLITFAAAPAIVRASSLMPIKAISPDYYNNPVVFIERFGKINLQTWQVQWLEPAYYVKEGLDASSQP